MKAVYRFHRTEANGLRLRRIVSLLVAWAALMTGLTAQAEKTAYVKTNSVKVYASASSSSDKLGTLNFGESITYVSKKGDWAKVKSDDGRVGFCKLSALTAKNPNAAEKTVYAKSDGVKAYRRTSTSTDVLAKFDRNGAVGVVAVTGDGKWCRVKLDGGYGYVETARLSKTKAMEPFTVYIAKNTVQFYKSASTSAKKVGVMSYGESITCVKIDGSWAMVQNADGKTGWCKKNQLTTKNPNGSAETWYAAAVVSVYAQPSTDSKELGTLKEGQDVDVVAETEDGKWMRLSVSGKYGYAKAAKLTDEEPEDEAETPSYDDGGKGSASGTVEGVIALAVEQYGKQYVYATHGLDTFDCSGLSYYCFGSAAGVKLSKSAYGQGYDGRFGKIDSISALKRGDIVCFNTVESDVDLSDHTGIYLGDGKFIHASSSAGKVIVSSLASGYYNRQFSWGLRVVE